MALRRVGLAAALLLAAASANAAAPAKERAEGWIGHPDAKAGVPVVLKFRRELTLDAVPATLPVKVSADHRFVLHVNGTRVASGPSTGTVDNWRYTRVDLAPHLKPGPNVVAAVVWNFGEFAPAAQQSVATGFWLDGGPLSTGRGGWRVTLDAGHTADDGRKHIPWQYYVASAPEIIDAARASWDWVGARATGEDWVDAVAAAEAGRDVVADDLPSQRYEPAEPGQVVRSSLADGARFPRAPVTVPAGTTARLLLRRDEMISAYPRLTVRGGRGARIELHYGEALYDAEGKKADRDLVGDREMRGFHDVFLPDGATRTFAPLWWRTFRYAEIRVTTVDEPLTLDSLRLFETGYPFETVGSFRSDDPELDRIWRIGWRTQRVDAHETFMDSSYWEQCQYGGDTRLQMLITYAVSGDARLARRAIEAFAESDVEGGLMQGAYPSRLSNIIATFSFAWVGMLADWHLQQPDQALIRRHLPRLRRVLAWFEPYLNPDGLLGKSPHWNFIDWAGQRWDDRDTFPSWGSRNGSCLMTVMWLGALRQGAALERALGDATVGEKFESQANAAREATRRHCWNATRGLFADDSDREVFSQHMNVFAVLYDVAEPAERLPILDRITMPGRGIDAPEGMYGSTFYFAWYLARAFEHAGAPERYFELLRSWRELLPANYTTWPETRIQPRSDTHAWSAHPTADLLGVVAGIQPAAPGYARLRVAPVLGPLRSLDATAATPVGPVHVTYRVTDGVLDATITRPAALPGDFIWRGRTYPLRDPTTRLRLQ